MIAFTSLTLALAVSIAQVSAGAPPRLALMNPAELPSGAGCRIWPRPQRDAGVLFALGDWGDNAVVRISPSPSLIRLRLVDTVERPRRSDGPSIGDTRVEFWSGPDFQVTLKLLTTFACDLSDTACEVERFRGILYVSTAGKVYRLRIQGECGS